MSSIRTSTHRRLLIVATIGLIVIVGLTLAGIWKFAVLTGWDVAMLIYVIWVWRTVLPLSTSEAKRHAIREDPGRTTADILLIATSVASLVAVIFFILEAGHSTGWAKVTDISLGLISIVISWFLVHTIFALKYARLFYGKSNGEVDFNENDLPTYADFAYLAFTLGMTFQVSDTNIRTKEMRGTVLRHALLSYLFGTVIIATTINILASLS